jgi:hypothetical protein
MALKETPKKSPTFGAFLVLGGAGLLMAGLASSPLFNAGVSGNPAALLAQSEGSQYDIYPRYNPTPATPEQTPQPQPRTLSPEELKQQKLDASCNAAKIAAATSTKAGPKTQTTQDTKELGDDCVSAILKQGISQSGVRDKNNYRCVGSTLRIVRNGLKYTKASAPNDEMPVGKCAVLLCDQFARMKQCSFAKNVDSFVDTELTKKLALCAKAMTPSADKTELMLSRVAENETLCFSYAKSIAEPESELTKAIRSDQAYLGALTNQCADPENPDCASEDTLKKILEDDKIKFQDRLLLQAGISEAKKVDQQLSPPPPGRNLRDQPYRLPPSQATPPDAASSPTNPGSGETFQTPATPKRTWPRPPQGFWECMFHDTALSTYACTCYARYPQWLVDFMGPDFAGACLIPNWNKR